MSLSWWSEKGGTVTRTVLYRLPSESTSWTPASRKNPVGFMTSAFVRWLGSFGIPVRYRSARIELSNSTEFRSGWPGAVSYTHLRAHETRHDLVCRLLLEKK